MIRDTPQNGIAALGRAEQTCCTMRIVGRVSADVVAGHGLAGVVRAGHIVIAVQGVKASPEAASLIATLTRGATDRRKLTGPGRRIARADQARIGRRAIHRHINADAGRADVRRTVVAVTAV